MVGPVECPEPAAARGGRSAAGGERRAAARGMLRPGTDPEVLVELGYGFLWYRLLVGHAPLDDAAADTLAAHLTAATA
ncbi:TetR/AcrR family transcriptional regulator C-terminal ligand-binding domain-containing protein [Kitasatospora sp. NPDC093679]|uniref:TetR/AcrR family transcriptional regulator C-terminal ligand-binding domain-containing protein n=1 Tax=Kitasatospora sp. NPDC093679 TaxID=3154983 RepID=UPI003449D6D2